MIKLIDKQKIYLMHRDGVSNRQIATRLGIDKNTVNKYVAAFDKEMQGLLAEGSDTATLPESIIQAPKYDSRNRGPRTSTKEAENIIQECLDENEKKRNTGRAKMQMKKTDIHEYLIKQGFNISYSTVKAIVKKIELTTRHQETFIKQLYEPGAICEFDWGEVKLDIDGTGYKAYQMAVFTSSFCNYRFARLYRSQDTAAFQDSHMSFFKFIHGVYHTVVYDNMKVAVKRFVGPGEKEPTEALLQLSGYYGFNFRFCNVRRGNEKGHVERSVDKVRRFAFSEPGKDCFDSLEEANEFLLQRCREENGKALSDGRIPDQFFGDEKKKLLPEIPPMSCFTKRCGLHVDKYSTIVVNNVHYSVPDTMVGRKINARVYTDRIVLYAPEEKEPIAEHERAFTAGSYHLDIFHYLRTLKRKPGALPHSCALMQADVLDKKIYESYYSSNPKSFLEVMELIRDIGADKVQNLITELLKTSVHDLSAEKLRMLYRNQTAGSGTDIPAGTDKLSLKSKQTLGIYDQLRKIQSSSVKEAV